MKIQSVISKMAVMATLLVSCTYAQATLINALTFTSSNVNSTSVTSTRGYKFNVTESGLFATGLSFYDFNSDGLFASHTVGLWNPNGVLLASAFIDSGTSAALLDGFRYVEIPDVELSIGSSYLVGATFTQDDNDKQAIYMVDLLTAPGIEYVSGAFINNGSTILTRPTNSLSTGLMGGSFLIESRVAEVPEPSTLLLLALSIVGFVGVRRK